MRVVVALFAAFLAAGCGAVTRVSHYGPLPDAKFLVTLVVSEDWDVVQRMCRGAKVGEGGGVVVGCARISDDPVRVVMVVRYTDSLPSPVAFEIDAHELCHVVAELQEIPDPCHVGNGGAVSGGVREELWPGRLRQ